jgi:hypothetical protein
MVLFAGAASAAAGAFLASTVSAGPEQITYPADYHKWQLYATVDRYDTKQHRELYTSPEAVKAVREGRPIPDGTKITMAIFAAKVDDKGVPVKDEKGRFVKGDLSGVTVMEKRKGWGASVPEEWRNADWHDDSPHQISVAGKPLRTAVLLKGQSASLTFDEAGTIGYVCGLHPGMKGSIEVTK